MRASLTSLVFLLVAWIAGSQYAWLCHVRTQCGEVAPPPGGAVAFPRAPPGGPAAWELRAELAFEEDSPTAHLEDAAASQVALVVEELRTRAQAHVRIVGAYHPNERNHTESANLGLARAEFAARLLRAQGVEQKRIETAAHPLTAAADPRRVTLYLPAVDG